MTWIEVSGKTMEEAKQAAARELGAPVDQIIVEVVEESSKGFLGLGQQKVVIRASVAGQEPEAVSAEPEAQEAAMSVSDATSEPAEEQPSSGVQAIGLLERILAAMQFDARPELVSETEEEVQIEMTGDSIDIGRLIGRHGQTLDALQYLLGIAVNRDRVHKVRVLLDAEGYRERHAQMLEARARDLAARVKTFGEEAVLEPQSARDRRIVHMALADDPDIVTYSEGEGDDRHIVISPRK